MQPLETMERKGHFTPKTGDLAAEHGEVKIVMIDAAYLSTLPGSMTLKPDPGTGDGLCVEVEIDLKARRNEACLLG